MSHISPILVVCSVPDLHSDNGESLDWVPLVFHMLIQLLRILMFHCSSSSPTSDCTFLLCGCRTVDPLQGELFGKFCGAIAALIHTEGFSTMIAPAWGCVDVCDLVWRDATEKCPLLQQNVTFCLSRPSRLVLMQSQQVHVSINKNSTMVNACEKLSVWRSHSFKL